MKNKKIGFFINLILFALFIASVIYFSLIKLNNSPIIWWEVLLLILGGIAVNYAIALLLHEIGHVIFAKVGNMEIQHVNFGLFSIDYTSGKKTKWFTFFGQSAGDVELLPKATITKRNLKTLAGGGLLFSFVYAVFNLLMLALCKNDLLVCFFGIGGLSSVYLFIVNFLPLDKTSDGSMLLLNNEYLELLVEVIQHEGQVLRGEIPKPHHIFEVSNQPLAIYYRYKYLLLYERYQKANQIILGLKTQYAFLTDQEYELIFPEILCAEFINGELSKDTLTRAQNFFTGYGVTPAIARAHYCYRCVQGETEWAQSLKRTYNRLAQSQSNFEKSVEKNIQTQLNLNS